MRWFWRFNLLAVIVLGGSYLLVQDSSDLHAEGGPIEMAQLGLWCVSATAAAAQCMRRSRLPVDRFFALGLAGVAGLAGLRECDAHILLNPEHLGPVGVRYRLDWWISPATLLVLRQFWATVFLAGVAPLAMGFAVSGPALLRVLRAPGALGRLLILTGVLLAAGFAFDDLLRGAVLAPLPVRQAIEEILEFGAAAAFLAAVLAAWIRPLSLRDIECCRAVQ